MLFLLLCVVSAQQVDFSTWGRGFDDGRDHGCGGACPMHPSCCGRDPACTNTFKACMLVAWADCVNPRSGWTDPTLQVRMCNPKGYVSNNPVVTCGAGPTPCYQPSVAPATEAPTTTRGYEAPTKGATLYDAPTPPPSPYSRIARSRRDRERIQREWDARRARRAAAAYQSAQQPPAYARSARRPRSAGDRERIQSEWDARRARRGYGSNARPQYQQKPAQEAVPRYQREPAAQPLIVDVGEPRYRR